MTTQELNDHYFEVRGCKIKRKYLNKKQAKEVAVVMNRRKDSGRVRAYSCNYCEGYHVGHIKPSTQDKQEMKQIEKVLSRSPVM